MLRAGLCKDVQLLLRDRGALLSLFALPVIFMIVFGAVFQERGADRPRDVALWYADADPDGQRIEQALGAAGAFRVDRLASADDVRRSVARAPSRVGLVVEGRPIELVIDESMPPPVRAPLEAALGGVVAQALIGPAPAPLLVARTPPGLGRPLHGITSFQLSVPGNAVLFGFFLSLTVALSFVEERRSGTWRRILAAPVHRGAFLVVKLVPYAGLGVVQFAFLFGLGALAFGMRIGGSLVALALLTLATVLCATALGLAIAAFGDNERRVGSLGSICLLVMGLAGGAMVPRAQMPPLMQSIGLAVPHAWALDGFHTLLVRDGAGLSDVAGSIAMLAAFTAGFALIGALRFRRDD